MKLNHKIFTIIVTYNGSKWIAACLQSVALSTFDSSIIIVDNASNDSTLEIVEKNFPEVYIIKNSENLGFGKANNMGICHAVKNSADAVFLINQDTKVSVKTLENLVASMDSNPQMGIISPLHLNWKGDALEYYFKRFLEKNHKIEHDFLIGEHHKEYYEVEFVNAAAWLIPKKTLMTVGGFDPIFYHYGEDNNYCQRVIFHGFIIGIEPTAIIMHDSKKRTKEDTILFSQKYYNDEVVKELSVLADINKDLSANSYKELKKHVRKLILLNILRLDFNKVRGYLKKYRIFEKMIKSIKSSRATNKLRSSTYLDI